MAIPEGLLGFVKDALARGLPRAQIQEVLLRSGWEPVQVTAALHEFAEIDFPIPVPRPIPYLSAREAFLYLLLFTTLYLSAYNLGSLIFQFINLAMPDVAGPDYISRPDNIRAAIRWAVSSLIVAFPLFLYLSRVTRRAFRQDPTKRTSKVRRWLTYLTLFLAAGIIMGDLIALLNDLLGGELTARFLLKTLTVGLIAGAIFGHYLQGIRGEERDAKA